MAERWVRKVEELSVVPANDGSEPGTERDFPPELYDEFEKGKKKLIPGEKSYLALRGPIERNNKKVFVITKLTLLKEPVKIIPVMPTPKDVF
jgi:hypothetical protein